MKEDKKMNEKMLNDIYKHCSNNKEELLLVNKCGCFNCMKIFSPKEIIEWIELDKGKFTAFCPYCAIDSVIAESKDYKLTDRLLIKLHERWMEK